MAFHLGSKSAVPCLDIWMQLVAVHETGTLLGAYIKPLASIVLTLPLTHLLSLTSYVICNEAFAKNHFPSDAS